MKRLPKNKNDSYFYQWRNKTKIYAGVYKKTKFLNDSHEKKAPLNTNGAIIYPPYHYLNCKMRALFPILS